MTGLELLAERIRAVLPGVQITMTPCALLAVRALGGTRTTIFLEADRDGWTATGWQDVAGVESDFLGGGGGDCLEDVANGAVAMARFAGNRAVSDIK